MVHGFTYCICSSTQCYSSTWNQYPLVTWGKNASQNDRSAEVHSNLHKLISERAFPTAWSKAIVPQAFPKDSICFMKYTSSIVSCSKRHETNTYSWRQMCCLMYKKPTVTCLS
jgi:hypothetical protein